MLRAQFLNYTVSLMNMKEHTFIDIFNSDIPIVDGWQTVTRSKLVEVTVGIVVVVSRRSLL